MSDYTAPSSSSTPPPAGSVSGQPAAAPGKTLGIVAFILSFFLQLVALILGIVALVQSRKAGRKNGFALAAIIISVVLMLGAIVLIVVFTALAGQFATDAIAQCQQLGANGTVMVGDQEVACSTLLNK